MTIQALPVLASLALMAAPGAEASAPPVATVTITNASGAVNSDVALQVLLTVDEASPPIEGITLKFSSQGEGMRWVSFTKSAALSNWVSLDPFDPSDGIVSFGTFEAGVDGTVEIGTLVVRSPKAGAYGVDLICGSGVGTSILAGKTAGAPGVGGAEVRIGSSGQGPAGEQTQPGGHTDPQENSPPESRQPAAEETPSASPEVVPSGFCGMGWLTALPTLLMGLIVVRRSVRAK